MTRVLILGPDGRVTGVTDRKTMERAMSEPDNSPDGYVGPPGGQRGEFSVYSFFPDGSYEDIRRFVSAEEGVRAFQIQTRTVGARMGIVKRVILTDGGDCINMEWKQGEGITYPPELKGQP